MSVSGALGRTPIAPAPESAPDGGKSARRADPNQEQAVFPYFAKHKIGSPVGAKPAVQTTAATILTLDPAIGTKSHTVAYRAAVKPTGAGTALALACNWV
ncbi:putative uncharacterized protein [Pseudomonas sp. StFLB209]|nr:putative uncharacterized protein [Pseudomonas sp. StFLB209]